MKNTTTLDVAQMGAPRCDPAFNRRHPDWNRLARRYVATRLPEHLAALPRVEGRSPVLYRVGLLTPKAYAVLRGLVSPTVLAHSAVLAAVHSFTDANGRQHRATMAPRRADVDMDVAEEAWLDTLRAIGGGVLLEELAEVVIRRHEIGDFDDASDDDGEGALPDPLDRYALPPGSTLARSLPPATTAGATSSSD